MSRILVVDDEQDIVELIRYFLTDGGYSVITAMDSDQALDSVRENRPDLVILDLKIPGVGGKEVCRILKSSNETSSIPIIILTGKFIKPEECAEGLEMGADDYILKPFSGIELVARVRAVLRRISPALAGGKKISSGNIVVDASRYEARVGDRVLSLTPKEFSLLFLLVEKEGHVLSRSALIDQVWGPEYYGTDRTVDVHIAHLRTKLGEQGKRIVTVGGVGYRLEPPSEA